MEQFSLFQNLGEVILVSRKCVYDKSSLIFNSLKDQICFKIFNCDASVVLSHYASFTFDFLFKWECSKSKFTTPIILYFNWPERWLLRVGIVELNFIFILCESDVLQRRKRCLIIIHKFGWALTGNDFHGGSKRQILSIAVKLNKKIFWMETISGLYCIYSFRSRDLFKIFPYTQHKHSKKMYQAWFHLHPFQQNQLEN